MTTCWKTCRKSWTLAMLSVALCLGLLSPAAAASTVTAEASYDESSRTAVITGRLGSEEGSVVTVQVRDPLGRIDYLNQGVTGTGGAYEFRYRPSQGLPGTYRALVGGEDAAAVAATFVIASEPTELSALLTPPVPDGQNGWYVRPVTVAIVPAADSLPGSGQPRIEYRIGDGPWTAYAGPFELASNGINVVEYRSLDGQGQPRPARSTTVKLDSEAPIVQIELDKNTLWPPNKKLVTVTASVYAIDPEPGSGVDRIELTSIASSEPAAPGDIAGAEYGTHDTSFQLRAARAGSGPGRTYTVTYTVTDKAGNVSTATANVRVPHDASGREKD